jgi:predicted NAD/FAD-binding protein
VASQIEPGRASAGEQRASVAVIGSGVAGLMAAYVASRAGARVTLYEGHAKAGGHADTTTVVEDDRTLAIDTGFIVHNRKTYPVLCRLFDELGVATQPSEMSMSIADNVTGLEWAGARGLAGVFPTWRHLLRPRYLRMLTQIPRFHRAAHALLEQATPSETTLGEFLDEGRFGPYFIRHFTEPLVAAVWSCDPAVAGEYPARYLFEFLQHHGMLSVFGSPQWRTVTGGSREYVDRVIAGVAEVRLGCVVTSVYEHEDGVEVVDSDLDQRRFDAVVIATHPLHALHMLAVPTQAQTEVLSAMPYSANRAILHTDDSLMPRARRAWASWNFRRLREAAGPVTVTYDVTRLQRLDTDVHYFVTLGAEELIDPASVLAVRDYEHPLYTRTSVAAQAQLREINSERLAFAGAYHGWGFHEDGARSGLDAAAYLGYVWPAAGAHVPQQARAS